MRALLDVNVLIALLDEVFETGESGFLLRVLGD